MPTPNSEQGGGSPGAVCASGGGSAAHGTRNEGSVWLMYHSHLGLAMCIRITIGYRYSCISVGCYVGIPTS